MPKNKRYLQKKPSYYEQAMQQANLTDIFNQMTLPEDFQLRIFWCRYIHYSKRYNLKPNMKLHSHSFFELHCVLSGTLQYNDQSNLPQEVSAGDYIMIAPKHNHFLEALTQDAETFAITFEPICRDTIQGQQLQTRFDAITVLVSAISSDIFPMIELIMKELHDEKAYFSQNVKLLLQILIVNLIRSIFEASTQKAPKTALKDPRLIYLKKYIGENASRVFSVSELAEQLKISSRQLNNIVKNDLGITAKAFIDTEKALQARDMLLQTDLDLQEISYALGFSDHNNFNRFFKRIEGMSPGIFRLSKGK